mmetsp:Transcript_7286/g.10728  ORF Transcript_7286/g.10728 Transcript_7286/m.10728 type:complete len:544 (-) Transcript_7286:34-1665(-)
MAGRYRSHKMAIRLSEIANQRKLAKLLCKYHYPELKKTYIKKPNVLKENISSWRVKWAQTLKYGMSSYRGNHIKLYFNNALFFDFWRAIDEAKKYIILESYTIGKDETAIKTIEKLESASQRGVNVKVIYDFVGSSEIHDKLKKHHQEYEDGTSIHPTIIEEPLFDMYYVDEAIERLTTGQTETRPPPEQKMSFQQRKIIQYKIYNHLYTTLRYFFRTPLRQFLDLFNRNHSKRAVIDSDAFIGGNNIENKYSHHFGDHTAKFHRNIKRKKFRDFHSRVRGEVTQYIRQPLMAYFQHQTTEDMLKEIRQGPYGQQERQKQLYKVTNDLKAAIQRQNTRRHASDRPNGNFMQVYQSTPQSLTTNQAVEALLRFIESAKESIFITTPYLMLPAHIKALLIAKARDGVDVRIITCGKSDISWFPIAAQHGYKTLVSAGIRIYEYYDPQDLILHAKSVVIDGMVSSVGSMNMDYTSLYDNRESVLFVTSPKIASKMVDQFFVDLRHSNPITPYTMERKPFYMRLLSQLLYTLYKTTMHFRAGFRKRA